MHSNAPFTCIYMYMYVAHVHVYIPIIAKFKATPYPSKMSPWPHPLTTPTSSSCPLTSSSSVSFSTSLCSSLLWTCCLICAVYNEHVHIHVYEGTGTCCEYVCVCVHNSYDTTLQKSLVNFMIVYWNCLGLTVYSVLAITQATRARTNTHLCLYVCLRVWLRVTLNPLCRKLSNFHLFKVAMFVE